VTNKPPGGKQAFCTRRRVRAARSVDRWRARPGAGEPVGNRPADHHCRDSWFDRLSGPFTRPDTFSRRPPGNRNGSEPGRSSH